VALPSPLPGAAHGSTRLATPFPAMEYAAPAAGVLILLVLLRDIVITVFHPEGQGGPLFRVLSRTLWAGFRALGRRSDGSLRTDLLSMAGPVLAVLTPATWLLTLVVGFALIYMPWVLELIEIPGEEGPPWREAIYHSLNAASTLGLGDVRADHIGLRWLTAVQALAGFGMVTAALSYFMAVYRELPILRTTAMEISARLREDDVIDHISDDEQREEWDQWFEHIARALMHLRLVLAQYPILHFFRPRYFSDEFLLQLGRLLEVAEQLNVADALRARRTTFQALIGAAHDYIDQLHDQFVGDDAGADLDDPDRRARARYDAVLRYFALR
jgi:hypothetical protein